MPVKFYKGWTKNIEGSMEKGLLEEVIDIGTRANIIAPKLTGALVGSRNTRKTGNLEYTISYGGGKVPYAKRRYFENNKHPNSKKWLEKAAESVSRGDVGKYYRDKI